MGADQLLELWGLRISGGTLRSVGLRPRSGEEPGVDEVMVVVRYVESTTGFERAKDALVWVYCRGREASEFPVVGPGQTLGAALLRRGWGMHLGKPRREVAPAVVEEFRRELEKRLVAQPMVTIPVFAHFGL
jgi:hypothetical protein